MLPRSDRKIPPWVIATVVLFRLKALLASLQRKFELIRTECSAPRGSVNWNLYATRQISRANFLNVPCQFPDLLDDRQLRSAIKFVLETLLRNLISQHDTTTFVLVLINLCQQLLTQTRDVESHRPTPSMLGSWLHRRLSTDVFRDGITALEWTIDQRGLAGSSDLGGLPWVLPMDQFFEAWSETIVSRVVARCGGILRTGRKQETVAPITWDPPYDGSQRSLIPDLIVDHDDLTIIIDAKYKDHWEELQLYGWANLAERVRERHREDLLQILAYATIARSSNVLVCLAYPCQEETWNSLRARGRLFHRASIPAANRRVDLLLTAFPLSVRLLNDVAALFAAEIRAVT